jgi:hypothetical protein
MISEPDALVRLTRLCAELATDCTAMKARASEVAQLNSHWDKLGSLGRPELVLLAVNLHGWYTALETALERVARLLDQSTPEGGSWHIDLLAQMKLDIPGVRPSVLPEAAMQALHELRKFRHFFRNAYVLEFDPLQIKQRAADLLQADPLLAVTMSNLQTHLAATLAELAGASR